MKIDRLISIIMFLLERDKVSAPRLSEMFGVTTRTIYRDLDAINLAGIPIVSFPGVNGGVGIMEEYRVEKRLFTVADVTALLTGLRNIQSTISGDEVLATMAKVKGLVPEEQARGIELQSNQILIDPTPWFWNRTLEPNLEMIKTAMNGKRLLSFNYFTNDGKKSRRTIEPYRLVLKNSNCFLQGYCTTKKDFRIFRLSRISSLKVLKETFPPRTFEPALLDASKDEVEKSPVTIKLLIDASLKDWVVDYCGGESVEERKGGKLLVRFPFIEDDFGYGQLVRFGDKCECLEPAYVRRELVRRVKKILSIYKNDERTT